MERTAVLSDSVIFLIVGDIGGSLLFLCKIYKYNKTSVSHLCKEINIMPLHIINEKHCISSKRSFAYHPQFVAVYHQAAGECTPKRDDMPSSVAWIKKERSLLASFFFSVREVVKV